MKSELIIGLTGKNASGKGEVAGYLLTKGFNYYSLSDVIRDEMKKSGIATTRDNMIKYGNVMRSKYGTDILAKKIKKLLKGNSIVDSIRNTAEIRELKKLPNFILLGTDAPAGLRFKRICKRKRIGDAKTFKEFVLKEKIEDTSNSTRQQLSRCLERSDKIIINDGSLSELHKKIEKFLKFAKYVN